MKKYYPQTIAIKTAILSTLFFEVTFCVYFIAVEDYKHWFVLPVSAPFLFGFVYLIVRFAVEKFIYKKIRVLYKTIHNLKTPKSQFKIEANWLETAESDVVRWAEDQKKELESLKKLENYRREFLGNVSHELKTPIFNIQGYVLTLLDGGLDDPTINREYLLRAEKSINRMIAIVNDLDVISRLESGVQKLEYEKFDIVVLAHEVVYFYETRASEKNIQLVVNHNLHSPVFVYADKEGIRQVIGNLVENSIKYGKQNGRTKISFYDMDEHILTEVADNGIGIAQEEIPRVFERFYRTAIGRTFEHTGSGLGLAIVKHIIEAHLQTINVRSTVGLGTTFGFTLKKS